MPKTQAEMIQSIKSASAYQLGYSFCIKNIKALAKMQADLRMPFIMKHMKKHHQHYELFEYVYFQKGFQARKELVIKDPNTLSIDFPSYEETYPNGPVNLDQQGKINKRVQEINNSRIHRLGYAYGKKLIRLGQSFNNLDMWKEYLKDHPSFSSEQYQIFCNGFLSGIGINNPDHGIVFPEYELIYPNGPLESDQEQINKSIEETMISDAYAKGYNYSIKKYSDDGIERKTSVNVEDWKKFMLKRHAFYTSGEYEGFCKGFLTGMARGNPTYRIDFPSYETIYLSVPATRDQQSIENEHVEKFKKKEAYASGYSAARFADKDNFDISAADYLRRNKREYTRSLYDTFCQAFRSSARARFELSDSEMNEIKLPLYEEVFPNNTVVNNNNNNNNNNNQSYTFNPLLMLTDIANIYLGNPNAMDDDNDAADEDYENDADQSDEDDENNTNNKKQKIDG